MSPLHATAPTRVRLVVQGAPHLRIAAVGGGLAAAGVGVTPDPRWLVAVAAGGCLGALAGPAGWSTPLVVVALAVAGVLVGGARMAQTAPRHLDLPTRFTGDVVADGPVARRQTGGWRAVTRVVASQTAAVPVGTRLMLGLEAAPSAGAVLGVRVTLRPAARPDAPAWWRRYLDRLGVAAQGTPAEVARRGSRTGLPGVRDAAAAQARRVLRRSAPGDAGAIVGGIAVGADEELSDPARDRFRRAGLSHLLAVSGQNVALIGVCAVLALEALGASRPQGIAVAAVAVLAYASVCQPGASVGRAAVAALAMLGAEAWSRPHLRWHVLLVALVALLAWQPRAVADPGLLLSFAAVMGILGLMPVLLAALRGRLPESLAAALAVSGAASLATAPVLVVLFGQLSLAGLVANLAAVPLAGVVLIAALIGIGADAIAPVLAGPPLAVAGGGAEVLLAIARIAAAAPGASVTLPMWTAPLTALPAVGVALLAWRRSTTAVRGARGGHGGWPR